MTASRRDLLVGLFVIGSLAAMAYLSFSVGGLSIRPERGYSLFATFDEIGGLKPRAQVTIGGVRVGQVEEIMLSEDFRPRIRLTLREDVRLPEDTTASIQTTGLLGDQYLALSLGGLDEELPPDGEISYTQSAFVLEKLVGRFLQDLGQSQQPSERTDP